VPAGRYENGKPRRETLTVYVDSDEQAEFELAAFVTEVANSRLPATETDRDITMDDAIERYLSEHLEKEKGRATATIKNYRHLHMKWFSPKIGGRRVRDVADDVMDRIAGEMRAAGLSGSRLNDVRSLYGPFFRWAKRRGYTRHNPMAEFEVPRSDQVPDERVPPEVDQMCRYLEAAVEVIPDVAPVLTLYAVTGRRRAEMTALRRSRIFPADLKIKVDVANDGKTLKPTKNRKQSEVDVDQDTMEMLLRHCALMDERAAAAGVEIAEDAFVFSLALDCSEPMTPTYVTKRVAVLKEHLGIADKRPETIALEDEALRLRRTPVERDKGRPGPKPTSGMSYEDIGKHLGRSMKWAWNAVRSAERREAAAQQGEFEWFDGSIVAMRRFTSTELMDAGFNIKLVAQRQGHSPQVLNKHYNRPRHSARRKAADHMGRVIHGGREDDDQEAAIAS
jgi:site-specific recombinase XerC